MPRQNYSDARPNRRTNGTDDTTSRPNRRTDRTDDATATRDGDPPTATSAPAPAAAAAAVPLEEQLIPVIGEGDALARLEIPEIGVDHIVVAGVSGQSHRTAETEQVDALLRL